MMRKQEIVNAAREYIDTVIFSVPSDVIYFEAGAEWADEHPINVWHDASEEPQENSEILVQWNVKGNSGYESYHTCLNTCLIENWDRFIERYDVSIWAYIDDLLPKQFGNSEQLKGGEK